MTLSALFEIDPATGTYGAAGSTQNVVPAGGTVNCRVEVTTGVVSAQWTIFGTHGAATPAITNSTAALMSFAVPAGALQAYGIRCVVTDATGATDTKTSAVYVEGGSGRPFFVGERFERDSSFAGVEDLNRATMRGVHGATKVYGGVETFTGTNNTVVLQTHPHGISGNGEVFTRARAIVLTSAGDVGTYDRYLTLSVTGGGSAADNLATDLLVAESLGTLNVYPEASSGNPAIKIFLPIGLDITVRWSFEVTEMDEP